MKKASLATWFSLSAAAVGLAAVTAIGCSSSSSGGTTGECTAATCVDSGTGADTGSTADTGTVADTGAADTFVPDGAMDGGPPMYGACAVMGGFGWPCTATTSGADPTDCTDPNYPECFVGGQGQWCTKLCGTTGCTALEDAGCAPTKCNGMGYCK